MLLEEVQCFREWTTSGAHDGYLVYHDWGQIQIRLGSDCAFQHQRTPGADEPKSVIESAGGAGTIDHHVKAVRRACAGKDRSDGGPFQQRKFLFVISDARNGNISERKNLSHQEPEPSVSKNCDARALVDLDLLHDFQSCRQRLCEDSFGIGNGLRHNLKISFGKTEVLGKSAVTSQNAEDSAVGAVIGNPSLAVIALVARAVYSSDHPFSQERGGIGLLDNTDELVPENASEIHLPPSYLEIGAADPGEDHSDYGFSRNPGRPRIIVRVGEFTIINQSFHGSVLCNVACLTGWLNKARIPAKEGHGNE